MTPAADEAGALDVAEAAAFADEARVGKGAGRSA